MPSWNAKNVGVTASGIVSNIGFVKTGSGIKLTKKYDDIKKDNVPVDNWDIGVLFRLGDFGYYNDSDWSEGIINLLYNLNHQPFYRKKAKYTPKNEETTY